MIPRDYTLPGTEHDPRKDYFEFVLPVVVFSVLATLAALLAAPKKNGRQRELPAEGACRRPGERRAARQGNEFNRFSAS